MVMNFDDLTGSKAVRALATDRVGCLHPVMSLRVALRKGAQACRPYATLSKDDPAR